MTRPRVSSGRGDPAAERLAAAAVAARERPADLIVAGARVVEVHTGHVLAADVAVAGPRIAVVGDVSGCAGPATRVLDWSGLVLLPGLVEPHFHVGGSQLPIEALAEVLVSRGTTALGTCFYEPAVIAGPEAVIELLDRADETGLDVLLSPFHAAALGLGAFGGTGRFGLDDLVRLVGHPACVELREWNWGVSRIPLPELGDAWRRALAGRIVVGGHLEGLRGPELQASVALGARSDHETGSAEEALEKARLGVCVQAREGSGARDLLPVLRAVTELGADPRCFAFSTDEQELASIARVGHVDHKLRLAVGAGVAPVEAVRMATLNAALSLGVQDDLGSVAPGRVASLVAVRDLSSFAVEHVVARGRVAVEGGRYLLGRAPAPYPAAWRSTVRVERSLDAPAFRLPVGDGEHRLRVIGVTPGSLLTEELVEQVAVSDGLPAGPAGLARIAVVDRHAGGEAMTVALIRGLEVSAGAVAATINPGLADLMVVGVDGEDMALAARRAVELGGGIVAARGGSVRAEVPLPLLGIFSDAPAADTAARCLDLERAIAGELGSSLDGLLTTAGFACLAVSIPALKVCARGLVRVSRTTQERVDLVAGPDDR